MQNEQKGTSVEPGRPKASNTIRIVLVAALIAGLALLGRLASVAWTHYNDGGQDSVSTANEERSSSVCAYRPTPEKPARDVGGTPSIDKGGSFPGTATIDSSIGQLEFAFFPDAPCTVKSFAFLAGKKYFDGTSCHRLTTQGILVLQCGDPTGTGTGGPGYQFGTENLPVGASEPYPTGTLAMARSSDPNSNGSQFFIVYGPSQLSPEYTVFGKVNKGLDAIQQAAKAGHDGSLDASAGGGRPKTEVKLNTVKTS